MAVRRARVSLGAALRTRRGRRLAAWKRDDERRRRQAAELAALHETAAGLIGRLDVDAVLAAILARAADLVGTSHGYIYLREEEDLVVHLGIGMFEQQRGYRLRRGEGVAGRVSETGRPLAVGNYRTWHGRRHDLDALPFGPVVGVPLRAGAGVIGVLGLARLADGPAFRASDVELLTRFADLAALALENARLYTAVQDELDERRRAEGALRAAELRYRTLVEQLPLVIYVRPLDLAAGNTYVSPQVDDLLGYPPEAWKNDGELLARIVHPDDREHVLAEAERVRRSGEPFRAEYRYVRPDGRVVWVLDETRLVRDERGKASYVQGYLLDITERREAEEASARLAAIVESSDDAIFSATLEGVITTWNAGAARMYGYTAAEMHGRHVSLIVPDDRRSEIDDVAASIRSGESVNGFETVRVTKDGRTICISMTASPLVDAAGEIVGASVIQRDITEWKRVEAERERLLGDLASQNEQLRELDSLKDEFIALVSHELRTPLTSIRGYLELLLEDPELSAEQRRFLEVVDRNSNRLLRLVGDLLFLAEVEAGKLHLAPEAVDLATIAADSVAATRPAAEGKGLTLALAASSGTLVTGDAARLGQVLDNLVSNAVKFTPAGGRIDVRARAEDGLALLEVRDTGIGIPADERRQLFQPFFRTSGATESAIPGTGLGLAISKAIVEAHGGEIAVASDPGKGTTFRVRLPISDEDVSAAGARVAS